MMLNDTFNVFHISVNSLLEKLEEQSNIAYKS